ncbi:MAG: HAD family phosphatase [Bacteroidia bacterium]|nr:HAD family phosphatase [Bacteroidia bacterium]MDW8088981.1 HAD family phosphatase [Bacteroidia bacterium]
MIRYLLLDLGGVLYEVVYQRTLERLGLPPQHLSEFLQHPIVAEFEKGCLTQEEFVRYWQGHFPHLAPSAILEAWNAMLKGPLPQAEEVLRRLATHYPLALLSNTNTTHLELVEPQIRPWRPYFQGIFFSNRLGQRKPDPAVYRTVLAQLGWLPATTLFVDDNPTNLQGAQAAGLQTFLLPPNRPEKLLEYLALSPV